MQPYAMMRVDKYSPSDREQEEPMEAISYCRVSTEEQVKEGVSLAAQEAWVRAYGAVAGLSLIDNIRDEGGLRRATSGHPARRGGAAAGAGATPGAACGGGDA